MFSGSKYNRRMYIIENSISRPFVDVLNQLRSELAGDAIERNTSGELHYSWSDFIAVCLSR